MSSGVYSTPDQMQRLAEIIKSYCRLPVSGDAIPGAFVESVFAHVRGAEVLNTYDYIDVIDKLYKIGWSIKSTKTATPLTWKRVKLPSKAALIANSNASKDGLQQLGDAIINFCNSHAKQSMDKYGLSEIGYCRLIVKDNHEATYFEKILCTKESPDIFNPQEFEWRWSIEKSVKGKEQLSALHGWHKQSGDRWWSWHGLGENQLHFTGERTWWQSENMHQLTFALPDDNSKLSFDRLLDVLSKA